MSILILCTFIFQLSVKTGVMLWYEANKTYISKALCENRNRPQLHCDGKCVLAKKLQQAETQPENQSIPVETIHNEVLPCVVGIEYHIRAFAFYKEHTFGHYRPSAGSAFHPRIFHPPPAA